MSGIRVYVDNDCEKRRTRGGGGGKNGGEGDTNDSGA